MRTPPTAQSGISHRREFNIRVGSTLKRLRGAAGMSQEDVAKEIGIAYQSYQRYENGAIRLSLESMVKIAAALAIHPADFIKLVMGDPVEEQIMTRLNGAQKKEESE